MSENRLFLREATKGDIFFLYDLVNDEVTRKNSFDTHLLTFDEHSKWFIEMIDNPDRIQYILVLGDKPIGQVRLDLNNDTAEIDYSISKAERGKGYGAEAINLIIKIVSEDFPSINKLIGKVKTGNEPSSKCFIGNGFKEIYRQYEFLLEKR